jgi:putative tryptophan/tyrosine transport system substrate-binding protein
MKSEAISVSKFPGAIFMTGQYLSLLLTTSLLVTVSSTEAQQPKKVSLLGYLSARSSSSESTRIEAFRQGLRELGYVEGKNIIIEYTDTQRESSKDSRP